MAQVQRSGQARAERFRIVTASTFLQEAGSFEDKTGIYGLFLRDAESMLVATGYLGPAPFAVGEFTHLYTGASYELGKRVPHHLIGTAQRSNFRATLYAIDTFNNGVVRDLIGSADLSDQTLTAWMRRNSLVAYRLCADPKAEERALLKAFVSPLNIDGRLDPYARRLTAMRCAMNDTPVPRHCWSAAEDLFA